VFDAQGKGYLWSDPYPFGPRSIVRAPRYYLIIDNDEDPRAVGATSQQMLGIEALREHNLNLSGRYQICYQSIGEDNDSDVDERLDLYRDAYDLGQ